MTYAELAPVFDGDASRQELFLYHLEVAGAEAWSHGETLAAHSGSQRYVQALRLRRIPKRSIADVLI